MTFTPRNASARKTKRDTSSKFKGVSFATLKMQWRATIQTQGQQRHLGYFSIEEHAALAYDQAALAMFGAGAMTNARMGLFSMRARAAA